MLATFRFITDCCKSYQLFASGESIATQTKEPMSN